mgnify:FL=1
MLVRNFYIKDILNIALPIMLGNLGFILIGVGDVIVAGRHSTETLASVSIANAIINCIVMIGIGIISSLSAILSNYRGAGKDAEKYFYPALKFTTIASIIISFAVMAFIPIIDKLGFEPHLARLVKDYFWIISFSIFGAYLHCMSKEYLQAFEIVVFPNVLTVICIFVNLILNIIFAFGYGPIPEMGTKGLALSTLITRYLMGGILFWYCFHKTNIQHYKDKEFYKDLLKVGTPSSLAVVIEFIGFNATTVILGRISGIYAAAQNIVCTLTTVSFMIPFAISNATAVKVGFANGAKYYKSLKTYAFTGITMAVAFMACSAIVVGTFPKFLVSLFTKDQELINVCIPIVFALCFFQVFDGLQVALAGIFRGLKQTGIVMISNFIGYWLVSIPLGCLLAFKYNMDLLGFWYGLVCAAVVLCSIMFTTMLIKFKKMN